MLHTENTGVGYYRIWQQAKYLRRLGWEVVEADHSKLGINMAQLEQELPGTDIIITQRLDNLMAVAGLMAAKEIADCPLVIDVDDDIFDVPESSPAYKDYGPESDTITTVKQQLENADAVTVSTPALKKAYAPYNRDITVLRNCQDPEDWVGIKKPASEDRLIIGWAGSSTHYDDLKLIEKPIKKVLRKYPNVVFRLLGLLPDFLEGVPGVEFRKDIVAIQDWPKKLAELNFDIGLAPVVDRPFNRGKSNIKWQEYSMLEIPTIASKVGEYKKIQVGETGFLANTPKQWERCLEALIARVFNSRQVGQNSKRKIMTDYNIANNIKGWDTAYRRIIASYNS